ncbi:uncharacterized protein LOC144859479 isoform X2 [Branchiostoma floridae x Branchiostoma japonicum]
MVDRMGPREVAVCLTLVLALLLDPAKGQNEQWLEVFATVQGAGQSVMDAWNAAADVEVLHHKCPIVEQWDSLTIKRVKIVLEASDGNKEFIFNGENSGKTDWFTKARLLSSPYTDIQTEPQNYFSVAGEPHSQRRFYINRNFGGCPNDAGWLAVADAGPSGICEWERADRSVHPHVLYSKKSTFVRWDDTANVGKADRFVIYIEGENVRCDPGWLDVFSTVRGTGQSVYAAWDAPVGTSVLHNKCPVLEMWASLPIKRVQITLKQVQVRDKKFIFNGENSGKTDWFTKSNLLESPYTDLMTATPNYFSIVGLAADQRRFYINRNFGGCPSDAGWLVVADAGPAGTCAWERASTEQHPYILYSKLDTAVRWDDTANVGKADKMLISIDADGVLCSCPSGYRFNGDGTSCDEIDECADEMDNCSPQGSTCTNTPPGSFTCTCNSGYSGNGVTCTEIDECAAETDDCSPDGFCTNTPPGSFTCACNSGYSGNGVTCSDIDECANANGGCEGTCTNNAGSFVCSCGTGLVLNADGLNCDDVNECDRGNSGCAQMCTNNQGSYVCSCRHGYDLNADGLNCDLNCGTLYPSLLPASNFGVYQGKCFWSSNGRRPHNQRLTYTAALQACQGHGGTLIMIKDQATQTAILDHLKVKSVKGRKEKRFWMGLDDINDEKIFLWNDGTPLGSYDWFKYDAPHQERDCVTLWKPQKRVPRWFIKPCENSYPYICQLGTGRASCPHDNRIVLSSGKTYTVPEGMLTYAAAQEECRRQGGLVAIPRDEEEQQKLVFLKNCVSRDAQFLLGIRKTAGVWRDGRGTALGSFTSWASGEPNDDGFNCAHIVFGNNEGERRDKWADVHCVYQFRYVCEIQDGNGGPE